MKLYCKVFDIFLYQSIFIFLFGGLLYILNDPISSKLLTIGVFTAAITTVLGIAGFLFNFFNKQPAEY